MTVDAVRARAWEILVAVQGGADLDPCLRGAQDALAVERDRAFLAELVRGTLQWQGRYDHLLQACVARALPRSIPLLCLLRMGMHQLLGLTAVPPYAAVDQAVHLCRRRIDPRLTGFVNATLQTARRRFVGEGAATAPADPQARQERLRPHFEALRSDPAAYLSAWHSYPRWLVERWLRRYGEDVAREICAYGNLPAPVTLHALAPADAPELAAALRRRGLAVTLREPRALILEPRPGRRLLRELLAAHPCLIVQDAAVQEATDWLARRAAPAPDLPAVDLCAAPGGKTAHLAALWRGRPFLAAMELKSARLGILLDTLARTGTAQVPVVCGDGLRPPLPPGTFGAVLLDGPCSGTGVIRRHPEARWRLRPATVDRRAAVLRELAERACELLAPGGVLMYATCSLEPQENEDVLAALTNRRPQLQPVRDADGTWQRTWLPGRDGGDGFFAACLRLDPGAGR